MKNKIIIFIAIIIILCIAGGTFFFSQKSGTTTTESIAVKPVSQQILTNGVIRSQNEATLTFPMGGKLVYLPFKEGDNVKQGQVIAQLDSRSIEKTLESVAKTEQNSQIQFDIVNDFNGDRPLSDTGLNAAALRQLQTAMNTLDQTQLAVEIQKIALEQATLVSPIDGVIINEDVTTPYVNITPATTFSIADPTTMVFRANISETEIPFITVGAKAVITLDGLPNKKITGTVSKIYQQKQTLANGENIYQVDIQADGLKQVGILRQSGSVLIDSKFTDKQVVLVPSWVVLGDKYIWITRNNKEVLQQVTVGDTVGNMVEVTSGLQQTDKVIISPKSFITKNYLIH